MTDPYDPDVAQQLWQETHDAYLSEHPVPVVLDVACPRCGVVPGASCRSNQAGYRDLGHMQRQCKMFDAMRARLLAAKHAAEAAVTYRWPPPAEPKGVYPCTCNRRKALCGCGHPLLQRHLCWAGAKTARQDIEARYGPATTSRVLAGQPKG